MSIRLYNTAAKSIEEFYPINPPEVKIYSCGPTVYDFQHIGNFSAYIYWDILVRLLVVNNFIVKRAMNITDVGHLTSDADEGDDKIQKKATLENKRAQEIAQLYTDDFFDNWRRLKLIEPDIIKKASETIDQQIEMVRNLKQKGMTYQTSDGIYFDTSLFPRYANFADLDLEGLKAGARVSFNQEKKNPSDFALWKFSKTSETRDMEWPTPADLLDEPDGQTQMGFPGWHLECSAIIKLSLGDTIDIHTGGIDHIPVHHSNEIAQSESANGVRLANFWLHNNFLKIDGTKISKSLGNTYLLKDLEDKGFSAYDFKMLVLQSHYRSESNFTFENLAAAKNRLDRWINTAAIRHQIHKKTDDYDEKPLPVYATSQAIIEKLNDDLDTAGTLVLIDELFSSINRASLDDIDRKVYIQILELIDELLGLDLINQSPDIDDEQKQMIIARNQARLKNDYKTADKYRAILQEKGIVIRDNGPETIWGYKN